MGEEDDEQIPRSPSQWFHLFLEGWLSLQRHHSQEQAGSRRLEDHSPKADTGKVGECFPRRRKGIRRYSTFGRRRWEFRTLFFFFFFLLTLSSNWQSRTVDPIYIKKIYSRTIIRMPELVPLFFHYIPFPGKNVVILMVFVFFLDVDTNEPDEKSLITYISSLYDVFPDPPVNHPLLDSVSIRTPSYYVGMPGFRHNIV